MRRVLPLVLIALLTGAAAADQDDPRLDALFARLQETTDPAAAAEAQRAIWEIWSSTGDAAAQAKMDRGSRLMSEGRMREAIAVFDTLIEARPEWAEAWNKRATAYYLAGNYEASVADIQETLRREPRHFGALSGLGQIYVRIDKPRAALQAFEKALEVNPHMEGVRTNAEALREHIEEEERI